MPANPKKDSPKSSRRKPSGNKASGRRQDGMRETIESIVVAFILAFLFRTFEAEAFVIPTGSMAPTLMGRHKDVVCEQCGFAYTVGASEEIVDDNGARGAAPGYYSPWRRINTSLCPNCRHENSVRDLPVFKGDRILVNKFSYEHTDPDRWDVVVFKYPEDPRKNYIKRLVGRPGEAIKIEYGDVFMRRAPTEDWQILRKPSHKQWVLQQLVYDNNHAPRELLEAGWPRRWAPVTRTGGPGGIAGWSETEDGWRPDPQARAFELRAEGPGDAYRWLRYRHFVPSPEDWEAATNDAPGGPNPRPRPELITDLYGYNAYRGTGHAAPGDRHGAYWVGDLTVHASVEIREISPAGRLMLELTEGERRYRCEIDPNTGQAVLSYVDHVLDDRERPLTTLQSGVTEPGRYRFTFANVDDRLSLWIDGDLAGRADYPPPSLPAPREEDLIPVGIAAKGLGVRVSDLLLQRDLYYRGEDKIKESGNEKQRREETLVELLSDPRAWHDAHAERSEPTVFPRLNDNEFLVLGDNSPKSKDSRLWPDNRPNGEHAVHRAAVPRMALVGKAFYIYWPHAIPFGIPPLTGTDGVPVLYHKVGPGTYPEELNPPREPYPKFYVPFYPQVGRMERIR